MVQDEDDQTKWQEGGMQYGDRTLKKRVKRKVGSLCVWVRNICIGMETGDLNLIVFVIVFHCIPSSSFVTPFPLGIIPNEPTRMTNCDYGAGVTQRSYRARLYYGIKRKHLHT